MALFPGVSGEPIAHPESSLRVIPLECIFIANNETGSAFEAGLIGEIHSRAIFVPLVAAGGACENTSPMIAGGTDLPIDSNMRFLVDPIADQFK